MNIDQLLNQVRAGIKQAEGETNSQIPQDLQTDPSTEMPKNITAEGQAGDAQKVMELLDAIEQSGEAKGATENIVAAKMAEEMAAIDQSIIEKQAEHFGVKMADSFAQRLIDINNPPISEKQAAEMVKAAGEEEYARWYNAGQAMWDGYVTKAAEFGTDGGAGIIDNGGQPVPAAVNQSEADAYANDLAGYLMSEFGDEDGKSASEKQAGIADVAKRIKAFFRGPRAQGAMLDSSGKMIAELAHSSGGGGYRAGKAILGGFHSGRRTAGKYITDHPFMVGGGVAGLGAGVGAAGYGGYRYGPSAHNSVMGDKQSSDAGSILNAFKSGVITKKQAAEKLLSLN